jgi:hypothetical protein
MPPLLSTVKDCGIVFVKVRLVGDTMKYVPGGLVVKFPGVPAT